MTPVGVRGGVRLHLGFNIRSIPQPNGMRAEYTNSSITSQNMKNFFAFQIQTTLVRCHSLIVG